MFQRQLKRFLTFDDVGLIPRYNAIKSRLNTSLNVILGNDLYNSPFIPANMDSVIGSELAAVCLRRGAPIIFHRFSSIEEQLKLINNFPFSYMSIGVTKETNRFKELYDGGCRRFCIDIAHGHSQQVVDIIKEIKAVDSKCQIIAGNVCTADGFRDLVRAGADIIKVGVGPGAACTTRIMTGVGVPQFSAVMECAEMKLRLRDEGYHAYMIADGGIKHPRDACLAIAAGADAVMMGTIFARTFESAAKKEKCADGSVIGRYRGQASSEFMGDYFGNTKLRQPEGVAFDVKITKSADEIFDYYEGGLRSAFTYLGANTVKEFQQNAEFFESTSAYMIESNSRPNH
jgi:IMP dehydrogenase